MATADCDQIRDHDHDREHSRRTRQDAPRFVGNEHRFRAASGTSRGHAEADLAAPPRHVPPRGRVDVLDSDRVAMGVGSPGDRDDVVTNAVGLSRSDGVVESRDGPALHRIAEVRQRQGVTLRNVARRLGVSLPVIRRQEQPDCDLRLSELQRWQQVLEVPVAELLVESEGQLSGPVLARSRMVKLMKTAAALRDLTLGAEATRLARMLIDQILEIMPELADVSPWPNPQPRRSADDGGRGPRLVVAEDLFRQGS